MWDPTLLGLKESEETFLAPMSLGPEECTLPSLQLDVMKVLWRWGESSVARVQQGLKPKRELAYNTVMTALNRLHRKGAVSRVKDGREFIYSSELSHDRALEMSLQRFLYDFFDSSNQQLISFLQTEALLSIDPNATIQ